MFRSYRPNTPGAALDAAQADLHVAVVLTFEDDRAVAEDEFRGTDVVREPFRLTA